MSGFFRGSKEALDRLIARAFNGDTQSVTILKRTDIKQLAENDTFWALYYESVIRQLLEIERISVKEEKIEAFYQWHGSTNFMSTYIENKADPSCNNKHDYDPILTLVATRKNAQERLRLMTSKK